MRWLGKMLCTLALDFWFTWFAMLYLGVAHTLNGAHWVPALGYWPTFWLLGVPTDAASLAIWHNKIWDES